MSKLFKLKEWMLVPAAAQHLTAAFQEEVTPADVLRFALDGSLTLSVRFVNKCDALPGQLVPIGAAPYTEVPNPKGTEPHRDYGGYVLNVNGIESHVLSFDGPMTTLQGVYDLPMMGGEKLQVEHAYQRDTGSTLVTALSDNGTYVRDTAGQFFQLHQHFDDDVLEDGTAAQIFPLENFILEQGVDAGRADILRRTYVAKRQAFLAERAGTPGVADYSLLPLLPLDSELVVRTTALAKLLTSVGSPQASADKALSTKERETLLKLVIAMAVDGYGHDPAASKSNVPMEIVEAVDRLGMSVSDDTVRKYLKLAADTVLPTKPRTT
jgi:hypothetical protein